MCKYLSCDSFFIFLENARDSRSVPCTCIEASALTGHHEPILIDERTKIKAADGCEKINHVNDQLQSSGTLGDSMFLQNKSNVKDQGRESD